MSAALTPTRIADDVFEFRVESSRDAQTLARELRSVGLAEDVVAGLDRVCVRFEPAKFEAVQAWLAEVTSPKRADEMTGPVIEVPIEYGGEYGPDLDEICEALQLSRGAFIELHTQAIHRVEMIGFTPGFSYLSGLPDGFEIPRLSTPRPRVAAGSVGISAAYTGLYALAGPGGWPLIGRTDAPLFDVSSETPFLLQPGQSVKFTAA
ncbi:MAG: 5-oxoprolinase subunit PxpB [Henriciella sp.]